MHSLFLAVVSSAAMAVVLRMLRDQKGNRFGVILGNYLTCIVLSLLFVPDRAAILAGSSLTRLLGLAGGILFVAGLVCMQSSIRSNGAALSAAFSKLGLLVSLAAGILCFGERPSAGQIAGIVLVLCAFWLMHGGGAERPGSPVLLLLTLLCCGGGDAMAKVFERLGSRGEDALYFFWLFVTAALLSAALAALERRRMGKRLLPRELAAGLLVGIPNYFSSWLLLRALEALPSFAVYAIYSVGTILLVTAVSLLCFGERPGRRQCAGLGLILAALWLLNPGA